MHMKKIAQILLIDDDKDDQLFFRLALAEIEPTIALLTANNGRSGLEKLASMAEPPGMVFLDLNMPIMHGFECLLLFRANPAYLSVPIIIFSTSKNERDKAKAKELGASGYLHKPNDNEDLKELLAEILAEDFSVTGHRFFFG